ncbi:protein-L-isoaspartate(D-aspartate) O-methyltransferase [Thalassotalea sp. ND16A]|uniref:protein-L-isoaspartate(D-aspartate) O-methyltransferase n=1 Tax=Thalassotalea sp. ND16A TaxID=1535422 RepID=UPI0009DDD0E9|nr:protein-L-isoaspartate(D-aspartate) O-methyltransferase [Thalassotalea sp. ND16A]
MLITTLMWGVMPSAVATHKYPQADGFVLQRQQMVATIKDYKVAGINVNEQRILNAMANVPRHRFVPPHQRTKAYQDSPLSIGFGQTISQPYIVALMTQLADISFGMKVLEIGTGSGYQAAILFELTPNVYTMEIISPLANRSAKLFNQLALTKINHQHGNGYYGWPQNLQFDRILVTAAAAHIPVPLLKQLKPGGRMVIPIGPVWGNQELLLISKDELGNSSTRSILPVRFVPLTGTGN